PYQAIDGGANRAVGGVDYVALPNGVATIGAGQTTTQINIQVIGNTIDQLDRTFFVHLDAVSSGKIAAGLDTGIATILDDDGPVLNLSALTPTVVEPDTGTVDARFRVSVTGGGNADQTSPKAVAVHYATADGTAIGGLDYASFFGTLIIPANTAFVDFSVPVIGST